MSQRSAPITVDEDTAAELLEDMLLIKIWEEKASEASDAGELPGFLHLCRGHEGTHAAIGQALGEEDWLAVGGARLHGQYLAKGLPPGEVMAEDFGALDGSNRGRGGAMHVCDVERKLYGHAATIGSGQNPAVGLALAEEMKGTDNVVLTTIGDGGTSRGSFHTALIFAKYWDLPVVFLIENNQWAISTPAEDLPPEHLADYGEPLGMPTDVVDGSDVQAVHEAVSEAIEHARNGRGPTLIESEIARLVGHYEADKQTYRTEEEIRELRETKDPIRNWRERMMEQGMLTQEEYDAMVERIADRCDEAVDFARDSPMPDPEDAYEYVYRTPLYGQGE